jgi:hypothetical protein
MPTKQAELNVNGWTNGAGGQAPGNITRLNLRGRWRCRLCGKEGNDLPTFAARSGKRVHFFGLHERCVRPYFARRRIDDLGKFWDDVDLLMVTVLPQRHGRFEPD